MLPRFFKLGILLIVILVINYTVVRAEVTVKTISNKLVVAHKPSWVETEKLDVTGLVKSTEPVNGLRMLVIEVQMNYTKPEPEVYIHAVTQVTNTSALPAQTTVQLAYIPKYQTYAVTSLNIMRGKKIIDVRKKALVRFKQMEAPFGADQFESPRQVMIFVPGLQAGDIIDYSYLVRGTEKAMRGEIDGQFNLGAVFSVGHILNRLLVPKGEKLNIFGVNSPKPPTIHHTDKYDEYSWEGDDIASSPIEDQAPAWQPSYPVTYYSNFHSWTDVRKWAESNIFPKGKPAPEVIALAKKLTQGLQTETDKLRAVLTFMQRDIRYVGMELGRNNYKPFPATTVLDRRFGDCKDQTNLMLKILKALNIYAVPVLTNIEQRRWMLTAFPSPRLFDHVFVYAKVDGKEYWVDPTAPIFGDQDAKLDYVNYGYGLKLDGKATNLAVISDDPFAPKINKYEIAVMPGSPITKSQATVNIHSHIAGDTATSFRLVRDRISYVERKKLNRKFVAKLFDVDKVKQLGKADIIDNYKYNELDDRADFIVYKPWKLDDDKKKYSFTIKAQYVRQYIMRINNVENRVAPAVLNYPVNVEETFMVGVPDMKLKNMNEMVDSKYLHFDRKVWYEGALFIQYQYWTKEKYIAAADIKSFNKDIKSIKNDLGLNIYMPNVTKFRDLLMR